MTAETEKTVLDKTEFYGRRRWDGRASDQARKIASEIKVPFLECNVPAVIHHAVEPELEKMVEFSNYIQHRYDSMLAVCGVNGSENVRTSALIDDRKKFENISDLIISNITWMSYHWHRYYQSVLIDGVMK